MTFGMKKLEWCGFVYVFYTGQTAVKLSGAEAAEMMWLPNGEKTLRYVYSLWQNSQTWQTDRQTNRHIQHDGIGRARIASTAKMGQPYSSEPWWVDDHFSVANLYNREAAQNRRDLIEQPEHWMEIVSPAAAGNATWSRHLQNVSAVENWTQWTQSWPRCLQQPAAVNRVYSIRLYKNWRTCMKVSEKTEWWLNWSEK